MATVIYINNLNQSLVTKSENIMQRSANIHSLVFYVPQMYGDYDMSTFNASLEFVTPDEQYRRTLLELVEPSDKEGYLKYEMQIIPEYTKFSGEVSLQVTFTSVDDDAHTYVRKIESTTIDIIPIEKWSDLVTDDALNDLDQAMLKIEAQVKALSALTSAYEEKKADNLAFNEDGDLQLKSNGTFIGDAVAVATPGTIDDMDENPEGIIDLSNIVSI